MGSNNTPRYEEDTRQVSSATSAAGMAAAVMIAGPFAALFVDPNDKWEHTITDTQTGNQVVGTGSTPQEARDEALGNMRR